MEIFQDEGQKLTIRGKGVLPATLGEPWVELAKIIQSYITCEGRKDVVRPRHLKLLVVLKQKCSVNLPALLNSLLHDVAQRVRKTKDSHIVISLHRLIKLIIMHGLAQQQLTCDNIVNPTLAPPPENPVTEQQGPRTPGLRRTRSMPATRSDIQASTRVTVTR